MDDQQAGLSSPNGNSTTVDEIGTGIDKNYSPSTMPLSFDDQLKEYRSKHSHTDRMIDVHNNSGITHQKTTRKSTRNRGKNTRSSQIKSKRCNYMPQPISHIDTSAYNRKNFRKNSSSNRPPDWGNYLILVNKLTQKTELELIDKNLRSNIVTINAKATCNIPIKIIPNRRIHKPHTRIPMGNRTRNVDNLIPVKIIKNDCPSLKHFVPSILLSNTMSLAPKIDEIAYTIKTVDADIALFTETWLRDTVPDISINIKHYQLYTRDRVNRLHGGVYVCT